MKWKNNFLFFVIFIVFIVLLNSFAIAPDEEPPQEFDYENGDYSTITNWDNINWNKVDWDKIVYANLDLSKVPEQYAEKIDAKKAIDAGKGSQLTAVQIAKNFPEIDNLATQVSTREAKDAIKQTFGVTINSLGRNVKIDENNRLLSEGGEYIFDFDGKDEKWEISVDDTDGTINVLKPNEMSLEDLTSADHFNLGGPLDKSGSTDVTLTTFTGEKIKVKSASVKNWEIYVRKGEKARVGPDGVPDSYEIYSDKNEVTVYTGRIAGESKPAKNYVIISKDVVELKSSPGGMVELNVEKGNINQLFNMGQWEYNVDSDTDKLVSKKKMIPDERESLKITVSDGDALDISSRKDQGLTPLIIHNGNEKGKTNIDTGRLSISVHEGKMFMGPPEPFLRDEYGYYKKIDDRSSVAFEFVLEQPRLDKKLTLITSSSNKFMFYNQEGGYYGSDLGLEVSRRIEPNMVKNVNDLRYKYPGFKLIGLDGSNRLVQEKKYTAPTVSLVQATDQWLRDHPGAEKMVPVIAYSPDFWASGGPKKLVFGEHLIDPATYYSRYGVRDGADFMTFFSHEFDHAVIDRIIAKKPEFQTEYTGYMKKKEDQFYASPEVQNKMEEIKEAVIMDIEKEYKQKAQKVSSERRLDSLERQKEAKIKNIELINNRDEYKGIADIYNKLEGKSEKLFEQLVIKKTGAHPYAFRNYPKLGKDNYAETLTVYNEYFENPKHLGKTRINPELARMYYEGVRSLEIKPNDEHYWIVERAAENCEVATGSVC